MHESREQIEFFDPFAEAGEQVFDPLASMAVIAEKYMNDEVEHDYTADAFVSDAQALMLDAQFVGMMDEAEAMMAQMHQMCQHDQNITQAAESVGMFGEQMHGPDDGHGHITESKDHNHDDDDEIDPITGKRKKRKKIQRGWLAFFFK